MVIVNIAAETGSNEKVIDAELTWLKAVVENRIASLGEQSVSTVDTEMPHAPSLSDIPSVYSNFVKQYNMHREERLVLILSLVPHVRPQMLDIFLQTNTVLQRGYTEFGGVTGKTHSGFLPTGETALCLLAAENLELRFKYLQLFYRDHFFLHYNILRLEPVEKGEPVLSGQLILSSEIIDLLTTGERRKPNFSREFPARFLTTEMEWEDLVLSWETLEQLEEFQAWIRYGNVLLHDLGLGKRFRPGYKCLFYGPSGTGKTITASVLGKKVGREVYRIDLSTVVSKYIGETEKNLERLFDRAENMNCILFFDEADALFAKRTNVSSSHDRYGNQEVAYLLQRVEDFPGVVILASNFKGNLDDAFSRRFQAVVHFPMPNSDERYRLWRDILPEKINLEQGLSLENIANEFKLSGGAIQNVVRYALLMSLQRNNSSTSSSIDVRHQDLVNGIQRELQKEGKML